MKDRLWKSVLSGLLLLLFASFIGCASTKVKPDNFANFSDAVKTVENATDKSLIIEAQLIRKDDLRKFNSNQDSLAGLEASTKYKKAIQDRIENQKTGYVLNEYTGNLVKLSDSKLIDRAVFDQAVKDLNKSVYDLYKTINPAGPAKATDTGVITETAMRFFEAYLENKRKQAIKGALERAKEAIQTYASTGGDLADAINIQQQNDLLSQLEEISNERIKNAAGKPKKEVKAAADKNQDKETAETPQQKLAQKILDLKDIVEKYNDVLSTLQQAYKLLPKAHEDLYKVTDNPQSETKSLNDFLSTVDHLNWLIKTLVDIK
jgi:hypothetical protein